MKQENLNLIGSIVDLEIDDSFLSGHGSVFSDLQALPVNPQNKEGLFTWTQPGNVGNDPDKIGPGNPTAGYSFTPSANALFKARAPNAYANVYLYMSLPVPDKFPTRIVDFRRHLIADLTGWQALEFQQQLMWNGKIYNMAWQFNIVKKILRIFNYSTSTWIPVGWIPFPDMTKPLETVADFWFDVNSEQVTHSYLTINGTTYPVQVTQKATTSAINVKKFTVGEQIDCQPNALCAVEISRLQLRYI